MQMLDGRSFQRSIGGRRSLGAIGALAAGALAVGAYAIGALAIGRLAVGRARIRELEIVDLTVHRIHPARSPELVDAHHGELAAQTADIAREYVDLCRRGEFDEAIARYFSPDHLHVESTDMSGPPTHMRGIEAMRENSRGFARIHDVHGVDVLGPFIGEGQFTVLFSIDTTFKPTGARSTIRKLDLYAVEGGSVVRSEVFYSTPPLSER